MLVNGKKMAVSGLLMALSVVMIILSGVLDFNTLFFLAAAAFCVGIIVREYELKTGIVFFCRYSAFGFSSGTSEAVLYHLCHDGSLCAFCGGPVSFPWKTPEHKESEAGLWGREICDF